MAAHSHIGASSAYRWFACPGSVRLAKALPPAPSSVFAEEGTRAHDYVERWIKGGAQPDDVVPDEMVESAKIYVDEIAKLADGAVAYGIEERFHLDHLHPNAFGTADAWVYRPDHTLYVMDFKYGAGLPVEAKDNLQLKYYALGVLRKKKYEDVKEVTVGIVQPRCFHKDGPVRKDTFKLGSLLEFQEELRKRMAATDEPDAPLSAGDHCRFCPALGSCPELNKRAVALAKQDFAPAAYSPDRLAEGLALADALEAKIKHMRNFAHQEALAGRAPPGYKLVNRVPRRKYTDPKKAEELLELMGVGAEMYNSELKSPAQIEKILGKRGMGVLESVITSESSGTALVPDTDRRPAVGSSCFEIVEKK